MKTWGGRGSIGKGRGRCAGLGGGEGMLLFGEPEASSKELEVCFGELELVEERYNFFQIEIFSKKDMKIQKE